MSDFKEALSVLVSAADARMGQWVGVGQGKRPDSLIDELWEADAIEAKSMADMIQEAIDTVRESK